MEEKLLIAKVLLLNDEKAFAQLVERYQRPVRGFFLTQTGDPALSDDLAQETFIRVWERLGSFRQLSGFSTWLYRIAYNLWYDEVRSRRPMLSLDDAEGPPLEAEISLQAGQRDENCERERARWVRQAVARMDEPERTCIVLFYLQEQSTRAIARIMDMPEGTVRSHLSRGRAKLKAILENNVPR
jgi:RNA polymerase sigma-70 factor (ECF subfamily)